MIFFPQAQFWLARKSCHTKPLQTLNKMPCLLSPPPPPDCYLHWGSVSCGHLSHTPPLQHRGIPSLLANETPAGGPAVNTNALIVSSQPFPKPNSLQDAAIRLGGKITKWAPWPNNKSCHSYVFIPTCSLAAYLAWQLKTSCRTIYVLCVNSKPWKHGYFKQVKLLFNYIIIRPVCMLYMYVF